MKESENMSSCSGPNGEQVMSSVRKLPNGERLRLVPTERKWDGARLYEAVVIYVASALTLVSVGLILKWVLR